MNDREMLELAAKAVRYEVLENFTSGDHFVVRKNEVDNYPHGWNPLLDDGDAFILAQILNMDIEIGRTFVKATWYDLIKSETHTTEVNFSFPEDKGKCAKRAVVLAAAEIGAQL